MTILFVHWIAGMVQDESGWLELLDRCNEIAHSYNEEVAVIIIEKTKDRYLALFENKEKELRENWL